MKHIRVKYPSFIEYLSILKLLKLRKLKMIHCHYQDLNKIKSKRYKEIKIKINMKLNNNTCLLTLNCINI
jgi:hypothetical protein